MTSQEALELAQEINDNPMKTSGNGQSFRAHYTPAERALAAYVVERETPAKQEMRDKNFAKCPCGYGWNHIAFHFCPHCGRPLDWGIK